MVERTGTRRSPARPIPTRAPATHDQLLAHCGPSLVVAADNVCLRPRRLSSKLGKWYYRPDSGDRGFDQNNGVAGVVYILSNDGFKEGYYKIGCSRRSGHARAFSLNADANTGTPGSFKCVFEQRTVDCGRAERLVFERLHKH